MKMADRIALKFAKLSDEQKEEATQKVLENIKNKSEEESEMSEEDDVNFGDIEFVEGEGEGSEETAEPAEETTEEVEEVVEEESEESEESEGLGLMDEIQVLSEEIEAIKEDGKVDSFEVVALFGTMMDMVTELLRAKPGRKPRKKANVNHIADRVACYYLINAARGLQVKRKDKDLMSDTGGTSKTREREPDQKPPREDMKKPFRTKDKKAPERDKDTDNDKDMKS
jgi:hypothetical protein